MVNKRSLCYQFIELILFTIYLSVVIHSRYDLKLIYCWAQTSACTATQNSPSPEYLKLYMFGSTDDGS